MKSANQVRHWRGREEQHGLLPSLLSGAPASSAVARVLAGITVIRIPTHRTEAWITNVARAPALLAFARSMTTAALLRHLSLRKLGWSRHCC